MKNYIKIARVRHWIKNALIFIPAFFSKELLSLDLNSILILLYGFFGFSMLSSAIYTLNDILDAEKDKVHPQKKYRPIASGAVSKREATVLFVVLFVISMVLISATRNLYCILIAVVYLLLNILYSTWLKHQPIIETVIIVLGFLLRLLFGACLMNVLISGWLYLTVMSGAFYMAFGKRRGELQMLDEVDRRAVLSLYTFGFLDKNMYCFATLTNVFYSLWAINEGIKMYPTIPIVLIIFLKYSYNTEKKSFADPIDVFFKDKVIVGFVVLYVVYSIIALYFWK
ncbi:MAG: UbiA prenyltransferase family protein [Clostridia bacterium]|nr:UbiA prenyltransferase family protein [Clostridia bacterium]